MDNQRIIQSTPLIFSFKGIVSQDFEVCFFIPLDCSEIATPDGTGSFFLKSISCWIFYYSGHGGSSFPCERILAQGAATAPLVAPVREW
jgi:hypothetical protein